MLSHLIHGSQTLLIVLYGFLTTANVFGRNGMLKTLKKQAILRKNSLLQ